MHTVLYSSLMAKSTEHAFKPPVVVTGFIGSGHEIVGDWIADRLGRTVFNTFEDPVCKKAWLHDPDELATRAEIYNSLVMCRDDVSPRVIVLRARPFGRALTRHLLDAVNATSIFVDTPKELCLKHIESPDWKYAGDRPMTRAAWGDLVGDYNEVRGVVSRLATVSIRPNVWPGDFGSEQVEELLSFASTPLPALPAAS
jgi:hypothetical protein